MRHDTELDTESDRKTERARGHQARHNGSALSAHPELDADDATGEHAPLRRKRDQRKAVSESSIAESQSEGSHFKRGSRNVASEPKQGIETEV